MTAKVESPQPPPGRHTIDSAEEEKKPRLDPLEEHKAREEESLDQKVTYDVIRREGNKELERPPSALWWAAIAGGMSMGLSFLTEALLRSHLPDTSWRTLVTNLGYPIGFLVITLGSQQLFTENTITPIVPLLVSWTREKFSRMMRLQAVVLIGNIAGALAFALLIGRTNTLDPNVHEAMAALANETLRSGFLTTLVRGIFAGWLIALMVWMLPAASRSQVPVIFIMTYLIGLGGFAHVIVGSVEVLYLVITGQASVVTYVTGLFLPALIGNVIGGFVLVTWLNHGQVTSGDGHRR